MDQASRIEFRDRLVKAIEDDHVDSLLGDLEHEITLHVDAPHEQASTSNTSTPAFDDLPEDHPLKR